MIGETDFYAKLEEFCSPLPGCIPYDYTYKLNVKAQDSGKSLLQYLMAKFGRNSSTEWIAKIEQNFIQLNGKNTSPNTILKAGDRVEHTKYGQTEPFVNHGIKWIYEDDFLLVVGKPAPIPCSPSGRFLKNTVQYILENVYNQKLYPLHRLDANTTGVLIWAKDSQTANFVAKQFADGTVEKEYLAKVEGIITENQILTQEIGFAKRESGSRKIGEGKQAETKIEILKHIDNETVLRVFPKTGRTNQIRLHLASLGHPIVGDYGYKDPEYFKNNPMTYPEDCLWLHAHKITIVHPKRNEKMSFEAPM
jgi:23S rRNA pseudouridine1911/1915/1917 synthase